MNKDTNLPELAQLNTEAINQNSINIDLVPTIEKLAIINQEDQKIALLIQKELKSIALAVDAITQATKNGGRLIYIGAGTSGRMGVLDAAECPPTYNTSPDLVIGILAGGKNAMFRSSEGIEDNEQDGKKDLEQIKLNPKDIICGIAASGRTPYVIGALKYAKSIQAKTIALACNKNSQIAKYADIACEIDAGPEVISGSTRMKAGSIQKQVLNMLSTATMINLGKVYQNLMVDVQTGNAKLKARAIRIISKITNATSQLAEEYLKQANNQVKPAIIMILKNCDYNAAISLLEKHHGILRNIP